MCICTTGTMTGNAIIALLSFTAFLLAFCNGETFYVRSTDNETSCPPTAEPTNCRLISEYAADPSSFSGPDDRHIDIVFLPGLHTLNTSLFVYLANLTLRPLEPERNTTITCDQNGYFDLEVSKLVIRSLEFRSCSPGRFQKFNDVMIVLDGVSETRVENCNFTNNSITAILTVNGKLTFVGTNIFDANSGDFGGVLQCYNTIVAFNGKTTFSNNRGRIGGVLYGKFSHVFLSNYVHFENNKGEYGGVFGSSNSQFTISGDVVFSNNSASYGGTHYILSSNITFVEGNVTFIGNSATSGGALYMARDSSLNFPANFSGSVWFEKNRATMRGGAVFIQDSNPRSYCLSVNKDVIESIITEQECSFRVMYYDYNEETGMYFSGNYAVGAGSVIYGGALDSCLLVDIYNDSVSAPMVFDQIANYQSNNKDRTYSSVISSDPFKVCLCNINGSEPNCASSSVLYTVYPGASLRVAVVALGQRNGTVPATVVVYPDGLVLEQLENTQAISNKCSNLSYTIYAEPGYASLVLYSEGACLTQGIGLTINVKVLPCPPGFEKKTRSTGEIACTCDTRLAKYTDTCNLQNGTILRKDNDTFWVGFINETIQESVGIILYSSCPFDYCITGNISFRVLNESDAQCNHNRSGLLCGECSEKSSLYLGSTQCSCEKCSNSYLALLLFFAAAGLILVAFLLLLNLTVADGTINGLVFYANIVAANETLFFPSDSNTYLDLLKVFIAWINLDFGIESCFYDGMDAYAKTWLQYVFPLYIWALIGLVFVVAHFSPRASKMLGSNPVAVLATLLLLSYAKVLRTIIESFSSATLDYPQGESRLVWLYDGNVPFLDASDGRHTGLFVASFLVLLLLFIPYTLLLLTSQWLQIKSHWKVLSWLNKPQLRSFLDAYHAPYKPKHRYWTGLLLLVRFALLLTSARNSFTNPSVNFLVIQIFVLLVQMWAWINGGIYNKWYLNVLEAFFFLNLGLLAASTHHIKFEFATMELSSNETQMSIAATSSTLITAAVVAFIGIVSFHIYLKIPGNEQIAKYFVAKVPTAPPNMELEDPAKSSEEVTTTYVSFREPMLDDC